jgi:hypothetical protein
MVKFQLHHYRTLLVMTHISATKTLRPARTAISVALRGRGEIGIERPLKAGHVEKDDYGSRLCKGHYLRIADLGAWRGKSYRADRGVDVGFSQYEPVMAHLPRRSENCGPCRSSGGRVHWRIVSGLGWERSNGQSTSKARIKKCMLRCRKSASSPLYRISAMQLPMCILRQIRRLEPPCLRAFHSPSPSALMPVLSTARQGITQ